MMNHPPYKAILGAVFILFSLVFFTLLFEGQYRQHKLVKSEFEKAVIRKGFVEDEFVQLREDVNNINREVNAMASTIGEYIIQGSRINDTIFQYMSRADANQQTLDSLSLLEDALGKNEQLIDSLNRVFEKKSDSLLLFMEDFKKKELSLRLLESSIKNQGEDLWYIRLFMLVYLFFLALGLSSGIFMLLGGFK